MLKKNSPGCPCCECEPSLCVQVNFCGAWNPATGPLATVTVTGSTVPGGSQSGTAGDSTCCIRLKGKGTVHYVVQAYEYLTVSGDIDIEECDVVRLDVEMVPQSFQVCVSAFGCDGDTTTTCDFTVLTPPNDVGVEGTVTLGGDQFCATVRNPIDGTVIVTINPNGDEGYGSLRIEVDSVDPCHTLIVSGTLPLKDGFVCECPACHKPIPATLFWSDFFGSCTLTYGPHPFIAGESAWVGSYHFTCPTGGASAGVGCCDQENDAPVTVIVVWKCGSFAKYAKVCSLPRCDTGLPGGAFILSDASDAQYESTPIACGNADLDCDLLPTVNNSASISAAACGRGIAVPCTESVVTVTS